MPSDRIIADLTDVWAEMERLHQAGYPCTAHGIRLGLAVLDDETVDAYDAWRESKRTLDSCIAVAPLRQYLLRAAAVALRMAQGIDERHPPR